MGLGLGLQLGLGLRSGGGAAAVDFLDATVSSTVFELNAGQYTSGPKWENVTEVPADSSAKADNDWFLGADGTSDTADPTHNTDHWTFDGGDFFTKETANTSFVDDLGDTTVAQDWWLAFVWEDTTGGWGNPVPHFQTKLGSGGGDTGIYVQGTNSETYQHRHTNPTTNTTVTSSVVGAPSGKQLLIVAHSHSTNVTRFYANSGTAENVSHTYTTGTATPGIARIGMRNAGATTYPTTTKLFWMGMGNSFPDATEAGLIITYLEGLYGDLTP